MKQAILSGVVIGVLAGLIGLVISRLFNLNSTWQLPIGVGLIILISAILRKKSKN